ncbi:mono-ADP-ribosyltransferase sirtuin-6-like protein [Achlya hypogyna]|uniref:protein acetyllysine N-acetyltransferase n=1 Tax=Achlya hypogyna TaxID=1202772 RepID=A0A1V9YX76_ACHHY|nr:mono-ADP-ribosyltransferase sirtuin-6-like protein [Achlya hypogyna]
MTRTKSALATPPLKACETSPASPSPPQPSTFDAQCERIATLLASAKHLVAFTGAGISTSTGVPDYRGVNGIRTAKRRKVTAVPDLHTLVPSPTHMALAELHAMGLLKHVVTQNVDNLHRKSGIPADALTELHGNATFGRCDTCEYVYQEDFPVFGLCTKPTCPSVLKPLEARLSKRTRRSNGRLRRHVIGFDEPMDDIDAAIDHCEAADVALVLGTSLRVEPFCEMAGSFATHLILVNLQPTLPKLDKRAETTGVRMYLPCDRVMARVLALLKRDPSYEVPAWTGTHATEQCYFHDDDDGALVNVLAGRAAPLSPTA